MCDFREDKERVQIAIGLGTWDGDRSLLRETPYGAVLKDWRCLK